MDLASLALRIDSSTVDTGVAKLDQLTAAGAKAEAAVDRLGDSSAQTGTKIKSASQHAAEFAANAQRQASAAMGASAGVGKIGSASRLSANHLQNLTFQLNDMFVGLASGQAPLTVFIQQGAQIGQIAQQAGLGIGGMARALAGLAASAALAVATNPLLLGLAVAATGAYGAFKLFQSEVANSGELDRYAASLGLTKKEMKELEGVGITATDVFVGLYRTLDDYLGLTDTFETVKDVAVTAFETILTAGKYAAAGIYAGWVGGFNGIKNTWSMLPSVIGEAAIGAANLAINAVEYLINTAIRTLNVLIVKVNPLLGLAKMAGLDTSIGEINFGNLENPFAGAGQRAGAAFGNEFASAFDDAMAGMDSFGNKLSENILGASKDRIRGQANDIIDDRSGSGRAAREKAAALSEQEKAYRAALKAAQAYNAGLVDETAKIGKSAIELKRMEVVAAATAAQKAALNATTAEGAQLLRNEALAMLVNYDAWLERTNAQAATDFIKNVVEPLEFENRMLGLNTDQQRTARAERELTTAGIVEGTEAWERYVAAIEKAAAFEREEAAAQALLDAIRETAAAANEVGDALANAFGRGGGAVADMIAVVSDYQVRQAALAKAVKDGTKTQAQADAISKQQALSGFTALTGAAKTFFKEGTTGYKALEAAEKALAVVQLINTARSVAAGAARMFEVLGPFGFPAVAAMLGVMASLGFSGGKGGSATVPTAEEVQAGQGTGSVLGDSKAKSDSLTASLEIMSKNSNKDLEYSNSMVRSLRAIENNIGKLTSLIAKQLGVSGAFDTSGLGLGTTSGGLSGTLLGLAGGLPGLIASKIPIIGDIIGAVAKFVFSTKKTVTLIDQGLSFGAQTVADILENGLNGSTYQTVEINKKKKLFGVSISNSTKTSTTTNPLGDEIGNQVGLIVGSLKDGILAAADILGVQGAAAALDAFSVNIGKISLKDLTADEISKELEAVFSKLGDDMARAAIPGLDAFQKAGEGLFETLSRLAKDYMTIDTSLQSIGRTFGAVGASSVAAREELVGLFGTLDDFVEQTAFFRENFLTEAQQIAPVASALSAELTRLGLTGVTTKAAFAQTVLGLDLTTTAGQEMYAALMAIAPAFNAVSDYTEKLNKTTADGLKSTIDQFGKFVESLTKYRDQLLQGELQTGNDYARARAQFLATSLLAASGDAGGLGNLEGASKTFLAASRDNASTLTQYQRDVAAVVSAVDKGLFAASETVDYAELQLAALDNSVALLTSIDTNIAAMVPANQTPAPIAGAQPAGTATPDNTAMANELAQIRADQAVMAADIAKANAATLRFYNRWEGEGLLVRTDADTPLNVVAE